MIKVRLVGIVGGEEKEDALLDQTGVLKVGELPGTFEFLGLAIVTRSRANHIRVHNGERFTIESALGNKFTFKVEEHERSA